jgi:protein-L-isoaspartate O-methyltransferase
LTSSYPSTLDRHSQQLRQELVASLVASGALHSPALQQAFLTVPREVFVPCFYEEDETSSTLKWKPINAHETVPDAYLPGCIVTSHWSRKRMSEACL